MKKTTHPTEYTAEFLDESQYHKGVMLKKGSKITLSKEEFERLKKKALSHIKLS